MAITNRSIFGSGCCLFFGRAKHRRSLGIGASAAREKKLPAFHRDGPPVHSRASSTWSPDFCEGGTASNEHHRAAAYRTEFAGVKGRRMYWVLF